MSNFRKPALVSFFALLVLLVLVPCHGQKNQQRKKCAEIKDIHFPSVMNVSVKVMEEPDWPLNNMRNRSSSPWTYSIDYNKNRFPSTIREARCIHYCVDSEGNVDFGLNAIPIREKILVLYRETKGCKPRFVLKTMVISVGCTCVRAFVNYL